MWNIKMNHQVALVVYIFIASVYSAPIVPLQVLPMQYRMPQLPFLKQMVPNMMVQSPAMYPQPLVILLPNAAPNMETDNDRYVNLNEQVADMNLKSNTGHIDENKEAVVIEANPKVPEIQPKNAIVYLPEEGRFSLGQIISYIPFLPIEVNVPDTISWISNIIGGWFRPQSQMPMGNIKRITNNGQTPVIVMPYPDGMPQV